ncbi:hypothetical protein IWQ62_004771 [Dispira parvispora]|uniref:G-patch domain-containing protein n=1 Tax=Dispira parvispora TaxID=1520584 RepID=A0A9W8AL93_9FUNG|nr:hypothetical protein IWQ62_004771 [Dispira parvispora]
MDSLVAYDSDSSSSSHASQTSSSSSMSNSSVELKLHTAPNSVSADRMSSDSEAEEFNIRPAFGGLGFRPKPTLPLDKPGTGVNISLETVPVTRNASPLGVAEATPSPTASAPLPRSKPRRAPQKAHRDFAKFADHGNSVALKIMMKMGYQYGKGLGASGEGIVNPIETKVRPGKAGIAYGGFQEHGAKKPRAITDKRKRTDSSSSLSSSEDEGEYKRESSSRGGRNVKLKPVAFNHAGSTRYPGERRSRKPKVVYEQVDELIQRVESRVTGHASLPQSDKIVDMTGSQARQVESLDQLVSGNVMGTSMDQSTALDNDIRLIIDLSQANLDTVNHEIQTQQQRVDSLTQEQTRMNTYVQTTQTEADALERVLETTQEGAALVDQFSIVDEAERQDVWCDIVQYCEQLFSDYRPQWADWHLEELVVAVVATPLQRLLADWEPFADPQFLLPSFTRLRKGMTSHDHLYVGIQDIPMATATSAPGAAKLGTLFEEMSVDGDTGTTVCLDTLRPNDYSMTPYESLMYHTWLPRVRSALVNQWSVCPTDSVPDASEPVSLDKVLELLESWQPPLLPVYVHCYLLDHVVLPKLTYAVENYEPGKGRQEALHLWLHPWLPLLGSRMNTLLSTVRHRIAIVLKSWHPSDTHGLDLVTPWRYVFPEKEYRKLLKRHILPKLRMCLRQEFQINPRQQIMAPFDWVMAWHPWLPTDWFVDLWTSEFFPKWHRTLTLWLQQAPHYEQITQWYLWWKSMFPESVRDLPAIGAQFRKGLDSLNKSLASQT